MHMFELNRRILYAPQAMKYNELSTSSRYEHTHVAHRRQTARKHTRMNVLFSVYLIKYITVTGMGPHMFVVPNSAGTERKFVIWFGIYWKYIMIILKMNI